MHYNTLSPAILPERKSLSLFQALKMYCFIHKWISQGFYFNIQCISLFSTPNNYDIYVWTYRMENFQCHNYAIAAKCTRFSMQNFNDLKHM